MKLSKDRYVIRHIYYKTYYKFIPPKSYMMTSLHEADILSYFMTKKIIYNILGRPSSFLIVRYDEALIMNVICN